LDSVRVQANLELTREAPLDAKDAPSILESIKISQIAALNANNEDPRSDEDGQIILEPINRSGVVPLNVNNEDPPDDKDEQNILEGGASSDHSRRSIGILVEEAEGQLLEPLLSQALITADEIRQASVSTKLQLTMKLLELREVRRSNSIRERELKLEAGFKKQQLTQKDTELAQTKYRSKF